MHAAQRIDLDAKIVFQRRVPRKEDLDAILPVEGGLPGKLLRHHEVLVVHLEGEVEPLRIGEGAKLGGRRAIRGPGIGKGAYGRRLLPGGLRQLAVEVYRQRRAGLRGGAGWRRSRRQRRLAARAEDPAQAQHLGQ